MNRSIVEQLGIGMFRRKSEKSTLRVTGILINGTLGLAMLITTLYCMGNIEDALMENPSSPFMAIFHRAIGPTSAAAVMSSIIVVMSFSATTGCVASTSRVYWAFTRDKGLPTSNSLSKISPRTTVPLNAVAVTTVIACLLSLVNIGDATAFSGVIFISIAGLFGSYLITAALLSYRRFNGTIYTASEEDTLTNTMGARLRWGPWRVPGLLGIANNVFSCVYVTFVFFFSFWPYSAKVTLQTMNWSVLVTIVVLVCSILYCAGWARRRYNGPIIEVER